MRNVSIHYEISEDLMKPHKVENMVLNDGTLKLPLETFKKDNAHNAMYSIPIFNFNNMEQLQAHCESLIACFSFLLSPCLKNFDLFIVQQYFRR